jgi:hypothetical protein
MFDAFEPLTTGSTADVMDALSDVAATGDLALDKAPEPRGPRKTRTRGATRKSGSRGPATKGNVAARVYRFRAECALDVLALREILGAVPRRFTIAYLHPRLPDVEVELEIGLSLKQLRDVMRQVDDGHVMVQTVARSEAYTGERYYYYYS